MQNKFTPLQVCLMGIIVGMLLMNYLLPTLIDSERWPGHSDDGHSHEDGDYHVHADFLLVVDGDIVDLSLPQFMSTAERKLSDNAHLHDDDGTVVHMHARDISFTTFLKSFKFLEDRPMLVTNTCLELPEARKICNDDENEVVLYVNDEVYAGDLTEYVPADLDRVLLYAGKKDEKTIKEYLSKVEDRACIFSGSCPERGIAPPESCGLTCEL
ncbi:MAG: hypothetical protein R3B53_01095 [Candidatus Paceibacterota bacterium]